MWATLTHILSPFTLILSLLVTSTLTISLCGYFSIGHNADIFTDWNGTSKFSEQQKGCHMSRTRSVIEKNNW
uniref:Putative secreted protein n=1 Tax=Amblyomma triste TaxID=251400 RepID=A0A023G0X7_AMBTT